MVTTTPCHDKAFGTPLVNLLARAAPGLEIDVNERAYFWASALSSSLCNDVATIVQFYPPSSLSLSPGEEMPTYPAALSPEAAGGPLPTYKYDMCAAPRVVALPSAPPSREYGVYDCSRSGDHYYASNSSAGNNAEHGGDGTNAAGIEPMSSWNVQS